ncbi:pyrophosphatase [archaeon]|nr:pyrophosphatase [archaeon]
MSKQIDLNSYKNFVEGVTSLQSNSTKLFIDNLEETQKHLDVFDINMSLLMTSTIGMSSESGEFAEIVKKVLFQGKPFTDQTKAHLKSELGDVIWYWINACRAIDADPNEIIAQNVQKLESRYPGGKFDVYMSENRKSEDI